MKNVLDQYLDLGLLEQFTQEDYKKRALEVIHSYTEHLLRNKKKLVQQTILLLDPQSNPSEYAELKDHLTDHWSTSAQLFRNNVLAFYRMLALESLWQAVHQDEEAAYLIYMTAASLTTIQQHEPQLQPLYQQVWKEAAVRGERYAQSHWRGEAKTAVPEIDLQIEQPEVTIDQKDFQSKFHRAVSSHNEKGQVFQDQLNRSYPQSDVWVWAGDFAKHATQLITTTIKEAIEENNQSVLDHLQEALKGLVVNLNNHARALQKAAQPKELELLWWMESLYSPSEMTSYRDLPEDFAPLAMLQDMHTYAPAPAPTSLAYLLAEAHRKAYPHQQAPKTKLLDWVSGLKTASRQGPWSELHSVEPRIERGSLLLSCVLHIASFPNADTSSMLAWLGVSEDLEVTYPQLVMWLWRDHMVLEVLSNG